MHIPVKICGLTNLPDAQAAVACGADYLGFIFAAASPRRVDAATVRAIVAALPCGVRKVGVFVDTPAAEVAAILADCQLDLAQLCGDETAEQIRAIGVERVWKAVHLTSAADLEVALAIPAAAIVADTMRPGQRGGTGLVGDWRLAAKLARQRPTVLAGGLRPENCLAAVDQVRPFALDVGSGVESTPGHKDEEKLRRLFAALRSTTR